jgi:hypothetical protein
MRTNRIYIQLFATVRYEPPIPREHIVFARFTLTQQLRLQMVADHPTVTQATTRREQIAAVCELRRDPNGPERPTFRQVGTFLGGLSASAIEGQDGRAHELLLPPGRPSIFP